jgi:hypothetical protein
MVFNAIFNKGKHISLIVSALYVTVVMVFYSGRDLQYVPHTSVNAKRN